MSPERTPAPGEAPETGRRRAIYWPFPPIHVEDDMAPALPEEDEEQQLIDEAIQSRIRSVVPRNGPGRRAADGWTIKASDLTMIGGIITLLAPLLFVVLYVRDIANQVTLVVREQTAQASMAMDHEQRIKALESSVVRFDQAGGSRESRIGDHETRIRALEGR